MVQYFLAPRGYAPTAWHIKYITFEIMLVRKNCVDEKSIKQEIKLMKTQYFMQIHIKQE